MAYSAGIAQLISIILMLTVNGVSSKIIHKMLPEFDLAVQIKLRLTHFKSYKKQKKFYFHFGLFINLVS